MGIFNSFKGRKIKEYGEFGQLSSHSMSKSGRNGQSSGGKDVYLELKGKVDAIDRVQAVVEFNLDGTIITANDNFLTVLGYTLEEIRGKHHRIFMDAEFQKTDRYRAFWERLNRGEFDKGEYKRITKDGKEIWIQASYNPIFDEHGKPYKVIKFATDITAQKIKDVDTAGQLVAIHKVQGVIEFNLDGSIITANDNFLSVMGYTLEEIQGKHHRIFMDAEFQKTDRYRAFWERLNRGEFDEGEYKRIAKDGKEVWIQASYNPILDAEGKPYKVVKFATDITQRKNKDADTAGQLDAINKAQAVVEFNLDGSIITANDNFLSVMGYSLNEIRGQNHSMFAEKSYAASPEYKQFWQKLNRGEFDTGEYMRLGKGGKEIWIQASYNPIFDADDKVYKVVKFATDITNQKNLQKMIEKVLADTSRIMTNISEGDLFEKMDGEYSPEFQILSGAVNSCIDRLVEMVGEIRETSAKVSSGSSEIYNGNANLSQRTEEQAASLEETSAALEEITATVQQNAANARQANTLAEGARATAENGGSVVGRAIGAMQAISDSSNKINEIISVIDEIAFQTNLLALNAAVEAARAGDQGRGFAVVADEVRSLAGRSATAAKEIKELIKDSSAKVSEGSELVNMSGQTLDEIVTAVKKVNDIVAEISTASAEQATGIDEVNQAVGEMDGMTQQNTALVEQAAAASESLNEQAGVLDELIGFFKISR